MSYAPENPYESSWSPHASVAALAGEWERTTFIRRTYSHLAGAVAALVFLEVVIFNALPEATLVGLMGWMVGGWNWLIVLGAFMVVSWIAHSWAVSATSLTTQYLGLGIYVLAESVILVPLLYVASRIGDHVIPAAGVMTGVVFAGLTAVVFFTRADFSWLGRYLFLAGLVALGMIVCSILFRGDWLGVLFSGAMIALASGYVLYDTSNVLHHFRTDQYVAASLALFASVALLFWYILRLVIALSGRD